MEEREGAEEAVGGGEGGGGGKFLFSVAERVDQRVEGLRRQHTGLDCS